jgi:hypothetical protein
MKRYILSALVATSLLLGACKKEYADIGTPSSKIEGVVAQWDLTKFVVVDKSGIVEEQLDMSDFFLGATAVPNISFTIEGIDTLYTCDTTGIPLNVFGATSGRWRFDNNDFPTKIVLMPNDGSAAIDLTLQGAIRETDQFLKISTATNCVDKTVFTYDMAFVRRAN